MSEKICLYCLSVLVRKEKETNSNWKRREHCNSDCANKHNAELGRNKKRGEFPKIFYKTDRSRKWEREG